MTLVVGAYNKFQITVENEETGLPIDPSLVDDLNLHLYTERSKDIALYGNGEKTISNPSNGVFIVEVDPETSILLKPFVGDTAFLEGFTLPYKMGIKIDLGKVEPNRASDDNG